MPTNPTISAIDLARKISRDDYKERKPKLEVRLGRLQRKAIEAGLPVVVLFEGCEGAGKGTLINRFIRGMDPRHFKVHSINKVYEEELYRPYLWRFWQRLPAAGKMSVLDRSWYGPILKKRVGNDILENEWKTACVEMKEFERLLCDAGYLIIKIFLHITQQEQAKRYRRLEENPATAWRITRDDWIQYENYETFCRYAQEMVGNSDSEAAPWRLISAQDMRSATVEVFETIGDALEEALAGKTVEHSRVDVKLGDDATGEGLLEKADLSLTLDGGEYRKRLKTLQEEIHELQHQIYMARVPVVIAYEGWDAAGKGGNIKRLTQSMDPRGYEVYPVAAPNDVENLHHYLWRFWRDVPKAGHVGIFDRSWYGRVLVERVEGFCTEEEWKRAYREINEFERQLVSYGTVLVKVWVHIDAGEQLQRFEARVADPNKRWKITEEDWRNREKWGEYEAAVRDMLRLTSTDVAPWMVVESNCKRFARVKVLEGVVRDIKRRIGE